MTAAALFLLLLAPGPREPVGFSAWEEERDPLQRRLASLLVGEPVRRGMMEVVPLYARIPSEAGHGDKGLPAAASAGIFARETFVGSARFLRIHNPGRKPVFLAAGSIFRRGEREVYLLRDAILPGDFAALVPASGNFPARKDQEEDPALHRFAMLPPLATGLALHRPGKHPALILRPWLERGKRITFCRVCDDPDVDRATQGIAKALGPALQSAHRTMVGAVFLLRGEIAGVHFYASHALFRAELPDLLRGLAAEAVTIELTAGPKGSERWRRLRDLAALGDARGRALAYLRGLLNVRGEWMESYGEGFEVLLRDERSRTVGHAVLDHRRRVVHAAFYALHQFWGNGNARVGSGPAGQPRGPVSGGSEAPPGQVDRKARPTLAESRTRPRRPGPSAPSSPNAMGGGGGGRGR